MNNRLDKELVARNLVPSRAKAQELVKEGFVSCDGKIIKKNNYLVADNTIIDIIDNDKLKYVSRGGIKLEKAINEFGIDFSEKLVMDIGSSTGGFCDCALQHGAKEIIAIDVGANLLHESLRNDKRIKLYEKTNFKALDKSFFNIDIITCDVSFISLKHIIDKIYEQNIQVDIICLIKPQFEAGREIATQYKGIILNKDIHINIIKDLQKYFLNKRFKMIDLVASPIRGGDGNIEYLTYLSNKDIKADSFKIEEIVEHAFKKLK